MILQEALFKTFRMDNWGGQTLSKIFDKLLEKLDERRRKLGGNLSSADKSAPFGAYH